MWHVAGRGEATAMPALAQLTPHGSPRKHHPLTLSRILHNILKEEKKRKEEAKRREADVKKLHTSMFG